MLNRSPDGAIKVKHGLISNIFLGLQVAFIGVCVAGVLWLIVAALMDGRLN